MDQKPQWEPLEKGSLRPPNHALEVGIFRVVNWARFFFHFSLGAARLFILFLELLHSLAVALGKGGFTWLCDGILLGVYANNRRTLLSEASDA